MNCADSALVRRRIGGLKFRDIMPEETKQSAEQNALSDFESRQSQTWSTVEKSRHPKRPYTLDYVARMFRDFEELKGDRNFADDRALIAGVGVLKKDDSSKNVERKVFFVGHQKGRKTKEKIERNFGMAKPEGYRKAMRVMDLAERFGMPLLSFIDTPGAYPGVGAEERGQSEAIASSILRIFKLKIPTVGVVIGEGGSGGALAIGVTDRLLMLQNSTYSVISPESCAAILWDNAGENKRAATALKLAAKDTRSLGICDEIIAEGGNGAHESFEESCHNLAGAFHRHLDELCALNDELRSEQRFKKYRLIDRISNPEQQGRELSQVNEANGR